MSSPLTGSGGGISGGDMRLSGSVDGGAYVRRGMVRVATVGDEAAEFPASIFSDFIAVHFFPGPQSEKQFTVITHIPTGHRIAAFATNDVVAGKIAEYARNLAALDGWDFKDPSAARHMAAGVKTARKKAGL